MAVLGEGANANKAVFTKTDSGGLSAPKEAMEVFSHIFWARCWGPKGAWGTRSGGDILIRETVNDDTDTQPS